MNSAPNYDLRSVDFWVGHPRKIGDETWEQIQEIRFNAFSAALPRRSDEEVRQLLRVDDPEVKDRFIYPANLVEDESYNEGQKIWRPRVAVAYEDSKPVGWAFRAHNVSGDSDKERLLKQLTLFKRYFMLGELAVAPPQQHRGIEHVLGYLTFRRALPLQPSSAYVWPEEPLDGKVPEVVRLLETWGFRPKEAKPQEREVFGEKADPVKEYPYKASSARKVSRVIKATPGFREAYDGLRRRR